MSVIFHIAGQQDWERASSAGAYTTASLAEDGFIHCSTATQHAMVADHLFAGRSDLVLLLIDTDRLSSAVRFERPGTGGEAFPHVYGPMDLDAVFEVTPYRPGPDGGFHPHEEATGFAAHGAATLKDTAGRALKVMAGFPQPWWVAGGWALDLVLGERRGPTRTWRARSSPPTTGRCSSACMGGICGWRRRGVAAGVGRDLDPASVPSGSGRRPQVGSRSCVRRSRCCSRPRDRGSRTSGTSTAHSPPGPGRTRVAGLGAGAGASRARLAWPAVNSRHGIAG